MSRKELKKYKREDLERFSTKGLIIIRKKINRENSLLKKETVNTKDMKIALDEAIQKNREYKRLVKKILATREHVE